MNKAELIQKLAERTGTTKAQTESIFDAALDIMQEAVSRGEDVKLVGFGVFSRTQRASRIARNPKTGQEVTLPSIKVPRFKPGKDFRERVRE